ncbi:MAG: 50S ribosomal protein L9 [Bacteroidia bacterium]|nr:50S ribosomal protein L9 [Bacteroidia bacterium]
MEIILKQDVQTLGHKDDLVKVKDGYARNYLIPQGFAVSATDSNKKINAENIKQRAHKEQKLRNDAEAAAKKLTSVSLKIGAKTSSTGKIFGSINTIQIAEALSAKGYAVERKNITIYEADNIKEVGAFKAKVKLYRDITVDIDFEVVSE